MDIHALALFTSVWSGLLGLTGLLDVLNNKYESGEWLMRLIVSAVYTGLAILWAVYG